MIPIVWLLGASGVGKSTTAYRMLSTLAEVGVTAAYVDADQLRLAGGVPASESELIASSLPTLAEGYRAHGAEILIVAGIADDRAHLAALLPGVPEDAVLVVHLVATDDTIRDRITRRGWLVELAEVSVADAARLAPDLGDLRLDTTDRTPADLAARITRAVLPWLETQAHRTPVGTNITAPAPRRVVVLTGPGGVGLSSTGFPLFVRLADGGRPAGYVDVHQLGFLGTDVRGGHLNALRATNTRTVVASLALGGAETVVITGDPHTVRELDGAWDPGTVSVFWLHATPSVLAERLTARSRGAGPTIQGDHRIETTGDGLDASIAESVRESTDPALRPVGARVVDTGSLDPDGVAGTIAAMLGA